MRRISLVLTSVVLGFGVMAFPRHLVSRTAVAPDFVHFESAHVHPAVLTPGGGRLLVVNTPDHRLSVFDVTGALPVRIAEIPVGLEPVSVAALDDSTAWVVNNLSDDVSVVDLATARVRATLRVGDEPNDVVFAGSPRRAYVSVSQEDRVRVYDPANLAAPPVDIPIDGRYPRALAVDASGTFVYAAVFNAGNRTSVLSFQEVPADSQPEDPQFPRDPQLTAEHGPPPRVGLIVQQQGDDWRDMYGKLWNHRVPYRQHDVDIAEIPAGASSPSRVFDGLGAVNYAIAVSPADGEVAVASTEARNLLRFEPRIRGHFVDTQIGLVTRAGAKTIVDLNPHVDYAGGGTAAERDSALGIPTGIAFGGDGRRVYVTSLASDRLGVIDPGSGAILTRARTVAGPTGVVVDDARGRLYVVGRFHNQLQTLSTGDLAEVARTGIGFDPTPDEIVNGRKFFYGGFTSAHGEEACASCHLFGDFDNLAWDLGDPGGSFHAAPPDMDDSFLEGFDPMKGPMTTQSLRGLPGTGRLHWRADRENLAAFNPAFVSLMGRTAQLPDSEMAAFSEFVNALVYPPNPSQSLDRSLPDAPAGQPSARRGKEMFTGVAIDNDHTCNFCHALPTGSNRQVINDAELLEDQDMKVPQLRNLYKKTGFSDRPGAVNKRGFGFMHDGAVDDLFEFLKRPIFNFDPGASGDNDRRDVEAFLLAFDTGMAPAVGRQITFDASNRADAPTIARLDTLRARSQAGDCDLIARGRIGGRPRSFWYRNDGTWRPDRQAEPVVSTPALLALAAAGSEITVTGVPQGSGARMGNDRDRDGHLDGDELDSGSDPGDPSSVPAPRVNRAPSVSAGPDRSIVMPGAASLDGQVLDDGLPVPPAVRAVWRKLSGPGTVTFADSLAPRTSAAFSRTGSYRLGLDASDGALAAVDTVVVVVRAPSGCVTVLERQVAAGADDAEEKASSGSMALTSGDLELVDDGGVQLVGLRFTGVTIPRGVTITSAWLQFTADEKQSEATTLRIQGQDSDSAIAFTTVARNLSSRPRTDAFATWSPVAWNTVGAAGAEQRTPDLAGVIQEIVDRPGWTGRSLALIVTGTGHRTAKAFEAGASVAPRLHVEIACDGANKKPTVDAGLDQTITLPGAATLVETITDDGYPDPPAVVTRTWSRQSGPDSVTFESIAPGRVRASFARAGTYVLRLTASDGELAASDDVTVLVQPVGGAPQVVERALAAGSDDAEEKSTGGVSLTSSDLELVNDGGLQTVGLRFTNVTVPPGAIITAAWVQFLADEAQTEATSLAIWGQAADSAATFTTASRNVSSRPRTTVSVSWTPGAWKAGERTAVQRTPDLSAVIQAIVSRPGWKSGRPLAIIVTGTGHRTADAFEGTHGANHIPLLHVEYAPPQAPAAPQHVDLGGAMAVTRLGAVFPNPGHGPATVRFQLATAADVQLEVYDLRGALVRRLASGRREAGSHTETWDGRDQAGRRLPNGVYWIRFAADRHRETRKLVILE